LDEMGIAEFNAAHPGLEEAPEIFKRDFASPLESIFRENEQYRCPETHIPHPELSHYEFSEFG